MNEFAKQMIVIFVKPFPFTQQNEMILLTYKTHLSCISFSQLAICTKVFLFNVFFDVKTLDVTSVPTFGAINNWIVARSFTWKTKHTIRLCVDFIFLCLGIENLFWCLLEKGVCFSLIFLLVFGVDQKGFYFLFNVYEDQEVVVECPKQLNEVQKVLFCFNAVQFIFVLSLKGFFEGNSILDFGDQFVFILLVSQQGLYKYSVYGETLVPIGPTSF